MPSVKILIGEVRLGSGGTNAERELRSILMGDEGLIEEETKSVSPDRMDYYYHLVDNSFLTLRGAGSLGIDIVAMRGSLTLPIEVKTTKNKYDTVYFNDDDEEQYQWMVEQSNEKELASFYAYRRSGVRGERWRMYRVPSPLSALNFGFLPLLSETPSKHKIVWEDGLPLSRFIEEIESYGRVNIIYDNPIRMDRNES